MGDSGRLRPHGDIPELTSFICNLCATANTVAATQIDRETPSCSRCGSTVRFRAIIAILSCELLGKPTPLWEFPVRHDRVGIGLSDATCYADALGSRLAYTNTFYHQEPRLDISGPVPPRYSQTADFLISSEVFEHVPPPVASAFETSYGLLKSGGLLLLTTPWRPEGSTEEHFPDLHHYEILTNPEGGYELSNRRRDGAIETHSNLVFHGGPGSTLEMRVFSLPDIEAHLRDSGFSQPRIWNDAFPEWGIFWRDPWSLPLTARRG